MPAESEARQLATDLFVNVVSGGIVSDIDGASLSVYIKAYLASIDALGPQNPTSTSLLARIDGRLQFAVASLDGVDSFTEMQGMYRVIDAIDTRLADDLLYSAGRACALLPEQVNSSDAAVKGSVGIFAVARMLEAANRPCDLGKVGGYLAKVAEASARSEPGSWSAYFELDASRYLLSQGFLSEAAFSNLLQAASALDRTQLAAVANLDAVASAFLIGGEAPALVSTTEPLTVYTVSDIAYNQVIRLPAADLGQRVALMDLFQRLAISLPNDSVRPADMTPLERWAMASFPVSGVTPPTVGEFESIPDSDFATLGFMADYVAAFYSLRSDLPARDRCSLASLPPRPNVRYSITLEATLSAQCAVARPLANREPFEVDWQVLDLDYATALALIDMASAGRCDDFQRVLRQIQKPSSIGFDSAFDSVELWAIASIEETSHNGCPHPNGAL